MIPTITKQQLITRALELASNNYVDVIKLADDLGIDVFAINNGDDFNACIHYDELIGKLYIEVNENHPETRRRFSIAHELAHFVLHPDDIVEKKTLNRISKNDYKYDDKEKEADKLAAEILMPKELVELFLESEKLTTTRFISENSFFKIAEHFKVSNIMAILRLRELKYLVPYIQFA